MNQRLCTFVILIDITRYLFFLRENEFLSMPIASQCVRILNGIANQKGEKWHLVLLFLSDYLF